MCNLMRVQDNNTAYSLGVFIITNTTSLYQLAFAAYVIIVISHIGELTGCEINLVDCDQSLLKNENNKTALHVVKVSIVL